MGCFKCNAEDLRRELLLSSTRVIVCCQDRRLCFECHSLKLPITNRFMSLLCGHEATYTPFGSITFIDIYEFRNRNLGLRSDGFVITNTKF